MIKKVRKDKLPKFPFQNIAISLSGGGFRASAFHLGVLSYLSSKIFFETSLLERTRILSASSAGTFVGAKYSTTIKKGGTIKDCYKSLHTFMCNFDLVSEALRYLSEDKNWSNSKDRTLINAFAAVYHNEFDSELFGILWNESPEIHLKEICFNATEFNFGLPFRFQKTEKSNHKNDDHEHEHIGNNKIPIPVDMAKEIRISDIIAASSCFPFGFEPINFPDDFIHPEAVNLKDKSLLPLTVYDGDIIPYPIGLMDGSIDDNQGVDGVVISEERMRHYPEELQKFCSDDDKAIDLYIISDASSPKIEGYKRNVHNKIGIAGKWNFESLKYFGIASSILGFSSIAYAVTLTHQTLVIALTIFGTLGLLIAFILLVFSIGLTTLTRKMGVPEFVVKRLLHFDKLKLGTLYNLFVNRKKSAMTLVSEVFIKHMRRFSYEKVYGDVTWRPRLIMNAVFEFTREEVEKRKKKYPYLSEEIVEPGERIVNACTKANRMGTRLWFEPEELKGEENIPNTLIGCGQFTICFSLLEYIQKYIKNEKYRKDYEKYTEETKYAIDKLETELLEDWKKFKKNPYWMVKEWNKF